MNDRESAQIEIENQELDVADKIVPKVQVETYYAKSHSKQELSHAHIDDQHRVEFAQSFNILD